MSTIRLAGVVRESIVDGPGFRFVVFTQGCPHHCVGCHNPQSHSFSGGNEYEPAQILDEIDKNPLLAGVTFSGGEPFCQPEVLCELAEGIKKRGLNLITYTGYTYEQLTNKFLQSQAQSVEEKLEQGSMRYSAQSLVQNPMQNLVQSHSQNIAQDIAQNMVQNIAQNPAVEKLLCYTDYLVDGKFIEAQKDLTLRFRGSKNQRIIDVAATRKSGVVVTTEL